MSWGAVAVGGGTIIAGYLTAKEQAAAQRAANEANLKESAAGRGLTQKQFELTYGAASQSKREREDEINRQIQERFGTFQESNLAKLDPYSTSGVAATKEQSALLGLKGPEAQAEAMGRFKESPGQKFLRERAEKSLLRSSAAIGGLGGGNVRTALQEQAVNIASTDLDRQLERLSGVGGQGLQATQVATGMGAGPGYVSTGADIGVITPEDLAAYNAANRPIQQLSGTAAPRVGGNVRRDDRDRDRVISRPGGGDDLGARTSGRR